MSDALSDKAGNCPRSYGMGICFCLGVDVSPHELHQLVGNSKEVSRGPRFVNWKKMLQFSLKIYLEKV